MGVNPACESPRQHSHETVTEGRREPEGSRILATASGRIILMKGLWVPLTRIRHSEGRQPQNGTHCFYFEGADHPGPLVVSLTQLWFGLGRPPPNPCTECSPPRLR